MRSAFGLLVIYQKNKKEGVVKECFSSLNVENVVEKKCWDLRGEGEVRSLKGLYKTLSHFLLPLGCCALEVQQD